MTASLLLEKLARFHPAPQNDKYFDLVCKKQQAQLPGHTQVVNHPSAPVADAPGQQADQIVLAVETIKRQALAEAERTYLQHLEQLINVVFAKLLPETVSREILSILDHSSHLQMTSTITVRGAPEQIVSIKQKLEGREDLLERLSFVEDAGLSQTEASVSWEAGGIDFDGEQVLSQCRDAIAKVLEQSFEQE